LQCITFDAQLRDRVYVSDADDFLKFEFVVLIILLLLFLLDNSFDLLFF